jgi:serine phosphatase RsbU (regulator of sigma subunit)
MGVGDVFAVLSDGFYEAMNSRGDRLGTHAIMEALRDAAQGTAAEILDALRASVDRFAAGQPADDDRTAIILKRTRAGA